MEHRNTPRAAIEVLMRTKPVPATPSSSRVSQGRGLQFVVHLFFREFLGREISHALNRNRVILQRQFERPGAVFVFGVLYLAVADTHGVDIIKIGGANMRITFQVVGVLLVVFGCIWFLQGVNILPGSFMTGQIRWAVYGGIAMVVGIAFCSRRRG